MKKIYQTPTINVHKIRIRQSLMVTSSLQIGDSVTTATGAESRGFDGFLDDINEEEW